MGQEVILDFKSYYLHHTFMPLIEKTDDEHKQSIRQLLNAYKNMNATDIRAAWNKVTPNYLNGVWKKLWTETRSR
jgi:hypothetical protein